MKEFLLMRKDDIVASLQLTKDTKGISRLQLNTVLDKEFLPYGLKSANDSNFNKFLNDWNDGRCIPYGRPNYDKIIEEHGILSQSDWLMCSYMCSLTDVYWFKSPQDSCAWADVNFYQNGFTSNLYKSLFYDDNNEPINHFNSPELTTDGMLRKMWLQNSAGEFILHKDSSGLDPIEPCCELIASTVFDELRIDHVPYWIVEDKGKVLSACASFIKSDSEEFVNAMNLMRDYKIGSQPYILQKFREFGFGDQVDDMELGDSIVGNIDRHVRNYGVIIDADTHEIKRFCPLFDHGNICLTESHGHFPYFPTDMSFNKTIQSLGKTVLSKVEQIDTNRVLSVINSLPLPEQDRICFGTNFVDRIEKISNFMERSGYDIDRKQ